MKIFLISLLMITNYKINVVAESVSSTINFQILEKMTKCLDPRQKISLTNPKINTTEFTLTMWIRSTMYYQSTTKIPFLKFKNTLLNKEINMSFNKRNETNYALFYDTITLGKITYSTNIELEEIDFTTKTLSYTNWNFFGISFSNLLQKTQLIFFLNSILNFSNSLEDLHQISDLQFFPCVSVSGKILKDFILRI